MGRGGRTTAITHRIAGQRSGRVGVARPAYPDIFRHRNSCQQLKRDGD